MLEGNKTLSKAWLRFCHRSSFGLFRDLKPRGWGEFDFFFAYGNSTGVMMGAHD